MFKVSGKFCLFALMAPILGYSQTPKFPPQVLAREASVVGVKSTPEGATIKVDGTVIPTNPFMLLKKEKPRVMRFELAGYKPLEKALMPGQHYVMGIGVDFIAGRVDVVEFDQPPGVPSSDATTRAAAPSVANSAGPASAQPASNAAPAAPNSTPKPSGNPFGFEYGMTKEQVIAKLGKNTVVQDAGVSVMFSTAPNPHPDFDAYILSFSPQKGLLKIVATSRDIQTSDDGSELRSKFQGFLDALRDKYGRADKDFDFCKGNDVECRNEYFMLTLKEENRYLNSFWSSRKANLPLHMNTIMIDAVALGINKGYIKLSYEFEGWDAFADELNKKRNSTF